jgi:hypothetical protein
MSDLSNSASRSSAGEGTSALGLSAADLLRLLEVSAYNLYLATLVGHPAPSVEQTGRRMRTPQIGDVVLETSTIWRDDRLGARLGKLVRTAMEPVWTADEWREAGEDENTPIPTQRVWYLELPDGREYRWHNASFIAIPPTPRAFEDQR